MTAIDFYQEVTGRHALFCPAFEHRVYTFPGDLPETIGPCIKKTESLIRISCNLQDQDRFRIRATGHATNTDIHSDPQSQETLPGYPAAVLRDICTIFKDAVFRFFKAKKEDPGGRIHTTIVLAVYRDGKPVYLGDLMEI